MAAPPDEKNDSSSKETDSNIGSIFPETKTDQPMIVDDKMPSSSILRNCWMCKNQTFLLQTQEKKETKVRKLQTIWLDSTNVFRRRYYDYHKRSRAKHTAISATSNNVDDSTTDKHDEISISKQQEEGNSLERCLQKWFTCLMDYYSQDGRFYHTLVHIEEMFDFWQILKKNKDFTSPVDESIVCLAIWFHDVIYNPKSSSNEMDSASLYRQFANEISNLMDDNDSETDGDNNNANDHFDHERVVHYILETQKHDVSESTDDYLKYFVDIDMVVLGKESEAYAAYAGSIRQEYIHVPRNIYCEKRADILTTFINNGKPIFATNIMRETFEERARSNIQREISLLSQGIIPGEHRIQGRSPAI